MTPTFFRSPAELQKWLAQNHDKVYELWIGFYKKQSGKDGVTYKEALDEALCHGWIDGLRKGLDEVSYTIRFTPRKPKSIWSAVNIRRVEELKHLGRMKASGLKRYEERDEKQAQRYSFERSDAQLNGIYEQKFKANKKAWEFFKAQPPGYKRIASWWVISAKREETRLKRLATLMEDSENGKRLGLLSKWKKS